MYKTYRRLVITGKIFKYIFMTRYNMENHNNKGLNVFSYLFLISNVLVLFKYKLLF